MDAPGFRIEWSTPVGQLTALEPTRREVAVHAAELAVGYNEPLNAQLMGHEEPMSADEVVDHYEAMRDDGAHQFLLFCDGKLAGDADLRGLHDGAGEFAFMIGARDQQGKGLGTKLATMIYAFAFAQLGLHHVYASVVPHNAASRRVFEKLGCALDDSAAARAYADEPDDVTYSIDRATFERLHAAAIAELRTTLPAVAT